VLRETTSVSEKHSLELEETTLLIYTRTTYRGCNKKWT
jgi:hypothetical protein